MSDTTPNLGSIIPSVLVRKIIYAGYVIASVAVGGVAVFDVASGVTELPAWLSGAQAVIAYLAIPIGTLALANAPKNDAPVA